MADENEGTTPQLGLAKQAFEYVFRAVLKRHAGAEPVARRRIVGEGMSVATQEAVILNHLLQDDGPMDRLAKQFFAAIQPTIETPWGVAQSDFVYPATRGARPADFGQRMQYNVALTKLAVRDFEVHKLLAEVQHLLKPQSTLREPGLATRVMALMGATDDDKE